MRSFLKRVASIAWVSSVAFIATARIVFEFVGYVSLPEDIRHVFSIIEPALQWTLAVPPWVLWILIVVSALIIASLVRARNSKQVTSGDGRRDDRIELAKIVIELQKSRGQLSGFRTRVDKGSISGRPFEQLRRLAQEHRAVLRSLEKCGFTVPYLDVTVDPIGYMETAIEHADSVIPLLKRSHITEAKDVSAKLAERFGSYEASHAGF